MKALHLAFAWVALVATASARHEERSDSVVIRMGMELNGRAVEVKGHDIRFTVYHAGKDHEIPCINGQVFIGSEMQHWVADSVLVQVDGRYAVVRELEMSFVCPAKVLGWRLEVTDGIEASHPLLVKYPQQACGLLGWFVESSDLEGYGIEVPIRSGCP